MKRTKERSENVFVMLYQTDLTRAFVVVNKKFKNRNESIRGTLTSV